MLSVPDVTSVLGISHAKVNEKLRKAIKVSQQLDVLLQTLLLLS